MHHGPQSEICNNIGPRPPENIYIPLLMMRTKWALQSNLMAMPDTKTPLAGR